MKNYVTGILTRVIAGLVIGYLTAPDSGKKNRKKMVKAFDKKTKELTKGLSKQWDKTIGKAENAIASVKP